MFFGLTIKSILEYTKEVIICYKNNEYVILIKTSLIINFIGILIKIHYLYGGFCIVLQYL